MKEEHKLESINNWINELRQQVYAQRLELEDTHHGYVASRHEHVRQHKELVMKEKALRETQNSKYARDGRNEESAGTTSWRSLSAVVREKITRQFNISLPTCSKCRNKCILWAILENFKMWNQIKVVDYLTFPVNLQWFQVLVPCWAPVNACHLLHEIHLGYRKTFFRKATFEFCSSGIIIKKFTVMER